MIIEDFVLLGSAVPEWLQDANCQAVCTAGFSPSEDRLIRINPTAPWSVPSRWSATRVAVDRNPDDNRSESYMFPNRELNFKKYGRRLGKMSEKDRVLCLDQFIVPSIQVAKDRGWTLALVNPSDVKFHLKTNFEEYDEQGNVVMENDNTLRSSLKAKQRYAFQPRVKFKDEHGSHDIQIRDWGTYELMRNYADRIAALGTHAEREAYVGNALHLNGTETFLIGNMQKKILRNNWLVISVLKGLR